MRSEHEMVPWPSAEHWLVAGVCLVPKTCLSVVERKALVRVRLRGVFIANGSKKRQGASSKVGCDRMDAPPCVMAREVEDMNDRELLELAAKAAGFGDQEGRFTWTEGEYPRGSGLIGALWNYIGYMDTAELWNPITDDGDALRLAVKLGVQRVLELEVGPGGICATFHHGPSRADEFQMPGEPFDPYIATRRAIVRAAAEIGKAMP